MNGKKLLGASSGIIATSLGIYWWVNRSCSYYRPPKITQSSKEARFPGGRLTTFLKETDESFKKWITYQSNVFRINIGEREDGLRGIFASQLIEEGQCVFRISRKYIIGKTEITNNEWVQKSIWNHDKFLSCWNETWDACTTALILVLIYHKRLGQQSPWHIFCSTLPSKVEGLEVEPKAHEVFHYLKQRDVAENLTWKEYYWAYYMVQTRSFQAQKKLTRIKMDLKRRMGMNYDPFHGCLFPLGDLVNHSDIPNSHPRPWGFIALREIQPGEEITWNYHLDWDASQVAKKFAFKEKI